MTEMKTSLDVFKGSSEQAEGRIGELEDRTMEIVEVEEQKEKRLKKIKQSLRDLWDTIKKPTYTLWVSQEKREIKGQREYFKK